MRKRERENPCGVCGYYHKFEEDEVCGVCGHRRVMAESDKGSSSVHVSAFSTEILPHFLYLGSYDYASRSEMLKAQGVSRILNTLQEYKGALFGPTDGFNVPHPVFPSFSSQSFSFGPSKQSNPVHIPTLSSANAISIFSQPIMNILPQEFTFGTSQPVQNVDGLGLTRSSLSSNCGDISMDSS